MTIETVWVVLERRTTAHVMHADRIESLCGRQLRGHTQRWMVTVVPGVRECKQCLEVARRQKVKLPTRAETWRGVA